MKFKSHRHVTGNFKYSIDTIYTRSSINDELVLPFGLAELFSLSSIIRGYTEFPLDFG